MDEVLGSDTLVENTVADKGYHSDQTLEHLGDLGLRSYIAEPDRGRRRWKGKKHRQKLVYGP